MPRSSPISRPPDPELLALVRALARKAAREDDAADRQREAKA